MKKQELEELINSLIGDVVGGVKEQAHVKNQPSFDTQRMIDLVSRQFVTVLETYLFENEVFFE